MSRKEDFAHDIAAQSDSQRMSNGRTCAKSKRRIRDGKEWERTGKPRFLFGSGNCGKGKHLSICRASIRNAEEGFDPPLLHQ